MNIRIKPQKLQGTIAAISSKSHVHRLLIAAALTDANDTAALTTVVTNVMSRDIETTIGCLRSLGADITIKDEGTQKYIEVRPIDRTGSGALSPLLDCVESGSTARFLLPVAAAVCDESRFTGSGNLPNRPLSPLSDQMKLHNCRFSADMMPLTLYGRLNSGDFYIDGSISSQFVSGLLFALPILEGDSKIILTSPLQSSGYAELTVQTLERFGIEVGRIDTSDNEFGGYVVKGGQTYTSPGTIISEGDWSNAAFWLAASYMPTNGHIEVTGLDPTSLQKDKRITEILPQIFSQDHVVIDAAEIPDLVPILAAVSTAGHAVVHITNAARLRVKESDRLQSVTDMLSALGADIQMLEDGLIIRGTGGLKGGTIDACNDHRIPMSAAIASCACAATSAAQNDVVIIGAEAVNKSYPHFFEDFNMLGGNAVVI